MENKNVPEVRIPGYSGDWEQCKLGDILKINSGRDYKHLQQGDIPVYGTGGYMLSVNDKLSDEDAIGIGRKGTIDRPQLLKAPFWTVDTLFYMTTKKKTDLLFCYSLAQKINWKKFDESTGVPSLSKASIDKVPTRIPELGEQSEIGSFFYQLDNTISLHQQELDTLKQTKQGFLQKMFPKEGESVPEIRLPGFTDNWEQRRLGDIYQFKYGKLNNNPDNGGEYPIYGANGVIGGYHEFNAEDSIIIGHMGAYAGHVLWAPGKHFVTYNGTIGFPKIMDFDRKFGYHMLQHLNIHRITAGSGQPFVSYADLDSIKVNIPINIIEQFSIGKMLDQLEDFIILHEQELETLKQTKKAFLQKMFV